MMIRDCLSAHVQSGKISQKRMDEYMRLFDDASAQARQRGLEGNGAYLFAASQAAERMVDRARNDRMAMMRTVLAIDEAWEASGKHTAGRLAGLTYILGENPRGEAGHGASVGTRSKAVYATLASFNAEFIDDARSKMAGLTRDVELPRHVLRELYGEGTGAKGAKVAADGWAASIDHGLKMLRAAGVKVGELTDWRLPQRFDPLAVRRIGKDGFVARMEGWWRDGSLRLRDWEAEGTAYLIPGTADAENRVRKIVNRAYDNITTDAGHALDPGVPRGASLNDKYGRRRAFEWSTADSWLAFNREMGVGDDGVFDLMTSHLRGVAHDIALAQVLGPDPQTAAKTLIAMGVKDGMKGGWSPIVGTGTAYKAWFLENLWAQSSGLANTPVSEVLSTIGSGVRNWLSAALLPGAVLSATTDLGFVKATAGWNGLSTTRIGREWIKGLDPTNRAHRLEAARRGLTLELGLRTLADGARDTLADGASRLPGRVADFVMRAQGLAIHTQAARDAVGLEFQGVYGDLAKRGFSGLPAENQRTLRTYGITEKDWDILREKALVKEQGVAPFLDPARLAREGDDAQREAALKFIGAIAAEQRMAIPEGNTITRALWLGSSRPGTPGGEFFRGTGQFKSYPTAVMLMHGGRALDQLATADGWRKGTYAAGMIVTLTSLGALSMQLKSIAAGKDPERVDWNDPEKAAKFWARAFIQGGGAGIMGDYLKAAVSSRNQKDIAATIVGPQWGFAGDTLALAFGNAGQYFGDEKPNFGREAVKYANRYAPDVFYTRLALDRMVWDNLQKMVDPDAHQTFRRIEERARKETDQRFWWRPGRTTPDRGPALTPEVR